MILSGGLTPAWQHVLEFASFRVGAVNRAVSQWHGASGKAVNVAVALAYLNRPVRLATPLGGTTGQALASDLQSLPVDLRAVWGPHATRTCTTLIDRSRPGVVTELVEESPPLTLDTLAAFTGTLREAGSDATMCVLSGSLPPECPSDVYAELLAGLSCPVILDARGPELLAALPQRPLVVKPNREELAHTLGHGIENTTALLRGMKALNDRGAQWVVITQGSHAVWARSQRECWRLQPPRIDAINPIGSGDCMTAALADALSQGQSMPDALRWAVAAAVDNATTLRPARLCAKRMTALEKQIEVQRVPAASA